MGLACSQIQFLMLTARKADCERNLTVEALRKASLTREMTQLSTEYYSRLQAKNISYYANGKYNKMDYQYLMGGINYPNIVNGNGNVKNNNSMVLADFNGRIVLSQVYADALIRAGISAPDAYGRGGTFSIDDIPKIIASLSAFPVDENTIRQVMNGEEISSEYSANIIVTLGQTNVGNTKVDNSENATALIKSLVDFYTPIFAAAASNGWTTEYNESMKENDDYISDALVSGSFQLATVNEFGEYSEQGDLTYFITAGYVEARSDEETREEITAWYNAEKDVITEKETMIDLRIEEASAELEMIKAQIKSIESFINDAVESVFDWGSG